MYGEWAALDGWARDRITGPHVILLKWGGCLVNIDKLQTFRRAMEDSVVQHSPLLRLPCELRLRIYDGLLPIIPLKSDSPPTQFTGLLYSCKTIQHELEPEICKRIATAIVK